ncbi:MAG: glycosyltransferase [Planctomycetota bacterium]
MLEQIKLPPLLVFSDDWGRHPSSCQHLIRALLPSTEVTWVNTIGMRPPRLDRTTIRRGGEKILNWLGRSSVGDSDNGIDLPKGLSVIDAKMWPWMKRPWDRALNRLLLESQIKQSAANATVVTTIPIVKDLVGRLPAKRWVYYCVDDFSVWPGLDGKTLGRMEDELLPMMDGIVSASDNLAEGIQRRGFTSQVVTHGVDLEFWRVTEGDPEETSLCGIPHPIALFWGVIDRRMNADWLLALAERMSVGSIVLVGPAQDPDPRILDHERIRLVGSASYEALPSYAAGAAVLIMPYADLPVTRAMQPLKFKEYLATGLPVVAADLPAVREYRDLAEIVKSESEFVRAVIRSLQSPHGNERRSVLDRLSGEEWQSKAGEFAASLLGDRPDV